MTFDIKKLSTAFVAALMLATGITSAEAPLSEHDTAVLRATNVFYNLFATNALQAGRVVASGAVNAGSLNVGGNAVIDGSLSVNGSTAGGVVIDGPLTQKQGTVILGQGNIAETITIGGALETGTITLGQSTAAETVNIDNAASIAGAHTINIGSGTTSAAAMTINVGAGAAPAAATTVNILTGAATGGTQAVNIATGAAGSTTTIGNTTAATGINLLAGTTGLIEYQVGATSATNFQLNPIGSATGESSLPQRMVWAKIGGAAGAVSGASGVGTGAAGSTGAYTVTWSNTFAAAPTIVATLINGGTGVVIVAAPGVNGATFATLNAVSGAAQAASFDFIAIGA